MKTYIQEKSIKFTKLSAKINAIFPLVEELFSFILLIYFIKTQMVFSDLTT